MFISASGSYTAEAVEPLPPLKELAREASGTAARRTGRLVQLALVGAGRCVAGRSLPPETATYFTSGRGDLAVTVDLLVNLCARGVPPAPFDFINTVGNSACFHVAQAFGLRGRSLFVTRRHAPLETALRLAAIDMAGGGVRTALVGAADMCTTPLAAHRERIGVAAGTPVGEGSHWFLLTALRERSGLGEVRSVRTFADEVALRSALDELHVEPHRSVLAGGPGLAPDRLRALAEASGIARRFSYDRGLPWYDTRAGHGIHAFLEAPPAPTLIHIDADPSGRLTLLVIDASRPALPAPMPPLRDPRTGR